MALLRHNEPNNLGNRVTVAPLPGAVGPGKRVPMLQLRDGEDDEAQVLSIVLIPAVAPLDQPEHGPCVALLEWGTGNATVSAEVDFAKGTHIQLAASFLSIAARNDGNVSDGAGGTVDPNPGPQDVIAMVSGYGSRVAFGRTTRTFYFRNVAPNRTVTAPVPNFAKSVTVSRSPATASLSIAFLDNMTFPTPPDPGSQPGIRATYTFVGVAPPSIDLPAIVTTVVIQNTGTTPFSFLQLAFELSL